MDNIVRVVAALIRDDAGRVLLVRKRGTTAFMQPGGKRDAGEDDVTALARELDEELGCRLIPASVRALGQFDAVAANEPGWRVEAAVYAIDVDGAIAPKSEIAEMLWIDPAAPPDTHLAPLTRDHVLPLAAAEKFQALKNAIDEGMADVEAGRVVAWDPEDFLRQAKKASE